MKKKHYEPVRGVLGFANRWRWTKLNGMAQLILHCGRLTSLPVHQTRSVIQ
jgi:hypothetical protein